MNKRYYLFSVKILCILTLFLFSITGISQQTIHVDISHSGRTFEGIGALSAGASSRLLIDYPESCRNEILDLLFKPKYGASLHHLKVEIGGDVNSTCGSEPSVAHTREEFITPKPEYYSRGYEFWLMKEAYDRNPGIFLDILQWGSPAWIGNGNFYSRDNVDFLAQLIELTKKFYGLDIHYAGIWNERYFQRDYPANTEFAIMLKKEFIKRRISTQIVGFDETHRIKCVDAMIKDTALYNAIDVLGSHYFYQEPDEFNASLVKNTNKRIWASEDGPWRGDWKGALELAKRFNRNYLNFNMTKTIIWSLITSYYDILPLPGSGPMKANEPWSGHYQIQPALWAFAHFTQFLSPGWIYLQEGCGYTDDKTSSFTTLISPDGNDITFIIETGDAQKDEELTLIPGNQFNNRKFYVWKSDSVKQFYQIGKIKLRDGQLNYSFKKSSIYTISTTTGQTKGGGLFNIPAPVPFPLPYSDDFEKYDNEKLPKYTQDQAGAFEVDTLKGNKILKQTSPALGNEWHFHLNPEPYTILGDMQMKDYETSIDIQLSELNQSASVFGRINMVSQITVEPPMSYWTRIEANGKWVAGKTTEILLNGWIDLDKTWPAAREYFPNHTRNFKTFTYNEITLLNPNVIDSLPGAGELIKKDSDRNTLRMTLFFDGRIVVFREQYLMTGQTNFIIREWNKLKMRFDGNKISASLNGIKLYELTDETYTCGMTGFGCGWHEAFFDNLQISPLH
jgi:galactosylceramidase